MNQLNSSTSSFNSPQSAGRRSAARMVTWILIGLVAIDISINVLFAYPTDPKITNPSRLRLYFEYGRSTEGQLSRMTRAKKSETAPITLAGWYEPLEINEFPRRPQDSTVTFYGMSHAMRLGAALARKSDRFTPRTVGAPGAPSNWSYGAFLRDRGGGKSQAAVLAFMSVSLPMITSLTAMTWAFDLPMPYTEDKFYLADGSLGVIHPPYVSYQNYVDAFEDSATWPAIRDFFAKHDSMYSGFMVRKTILDHSALVRLIRRAYGQRLLREARKNVLDSSGFQAESEQIKVARAIVRDFASQARREGIVPVIYLVNNLGYSNHLFKALSSVLIEDDIPYLSSHTVVSPDDPRSYLPDSHFTDEADDKLAEALVKILQSRL